VARLRWPVTTSGTYSPFLLLFILLSVRRRTCGERAFRDGSAACGDGAGGCVLFRRETWWRRSWLRSNGSGFLASLSGILRCGRMGGGSMDERAFNEMMR